ncbi:auxin-induced protein 15A-like [Tasmannia lanceolata]|uniref:auxin-induced protein 15A-like n=1 Tax=Tasmannia lanceolata TaxID=3420 RepID=UPI004062E23F
MRKIMTTLVKKLLCCGMKSFPSDNLPKGHLRVYVGKEVLCKFELETNYLNHPLFEDLLRLSVDEFGYSYHGALRIACDIDLFMHLLELLKSGNPSAHHMQLQDLASKFSSSNGEQNATPS